MRRRTARWTVALVAAALACTGAAPAAATSTPAPGSPVTSFGGGDGVILAPIPAMVADRDLDGVAVEAIDAVVGGPRAGSFRLYMSANWLDAALLIVKQYRSDGSVDMAWNAGRARVLRWLQPDDKYFPIVVDGRHRAYVAVGGFESTVTVRRLLPSGNWDPDYEVRTGGGDFQHPSALAVARDGSIRHCQSPFAAHDPRIAVEEFDSAGSPLRASVIDVSGIADSAVCFGAAVAPDGSSLLRVALYQADGAMREAILKVQPGGGLDGSFGVDGVAVLPAGFRADGGPYATIGTPLFTVGRRIVATGQSAAAGRDRPTLVVLTESGDPDAGFGYGGTLRLAHAQAFVRHAATDLQGGMFVSLQSLGSSGERPDPGLLHLNASGRPVTAFGAGGFLRFSPGTGARATGPAAVAVFASGKLLVGVCALRATTYAGVIPAARVDKRWA